MDNGNCVELRLSGDRVEMRDSKNPSADTLSFRRSVFSTFVADVAAGRFDRP
jgi:hypothetical protein